MKNNESLFSRTITAQTNIHQNADKRKIICHLQASLKEEIQKRQELQQTLLQYRKRSIFIQKQFERILQKLDNKIAIINGHTNDGAQIWNKLIHQIENFNQNSQRMLQKRCGQIQFLMARRINDILDKTQIQIKKHKKLSQEQYKQVKQQIKQALKIATNIQNENERLKKQNKDYQFRLNLLNEEKVLLIEELNQKKIKLKKILKETYQYDHQIKYIPKSSRKTYNNSKIVSKDASPTMKYPLYQFRFICQPSFKDIQSTLINNPQSTRKVSTYSKSKNTSQMILKTQAHLKLCFERQKRKNGELKSHIANFNNKIKQIGFLIQMNKKNIMSQSNEQKLRNLEDMLENIRLKLFIPNFQNKNSLNQLQITNMIDNY